MAIQLRRGNLADFDKSKMVDGEIAITKEGGCYYCYLPGNVKRLMTEEDLRLMLNTSEEAYNALVETLTLLEDQTVLDGMLNAIQDVETKVDGQDAKINSALIEVEQMSDAVTAHTESITALEQLTNTHTENINTNTQRSEKNSEDISKQKLINNKCILLGDSMNTGEGWGYYFRQLSGANCEILAEGSMGYTKTGSFGNTFLSKLTSFLNTTPFEERETYDYLIIGGGVNDYATTTSSLRTAVINFLNYAKTNLPNAKIFIWVNHTFAPVSSTLLELYNTIYDTAMENDAHVSTELMRVAVDHKPTWNSDGVHMTATGYKEYAMNIINALQGYTILKPIPFLLGAISGRGAFTEQNNTICGGIVQINSVFGVSSNPPTGITSFFSNLYYNESTVYHPCMMFRNGYSKSISIRNDGLFRMGTDAGANLIAYESIYVNMTYNLLG